MMDKTIYLAPDFDFMEFEVEQGFSLSVDKESTLGDYEYAGDDTDNYL